jgi:Arm DNA-binding domain
MAKIAKRQACFVETTRAGRLRFRFRWKLPNGRRRFFAEATILSDTSHNRRLAEKEAALIGAEIRAGVFDYLKWFPNGNRANDFLRPVIASGKPVPTLREFYDRWIATKNPPTVRESLVSNRLDSRPTRPAVGTTHSRFAAWSSGSQRACACTRPAQPWRASPRRANVDSSRR